MKTIKQYELFTFQVKHIDSKVYVPKQAIARHELSGMGAFRTKPDEQVRFGENIDYMMQFQWQPVSTLEARTLRPAQIFGLYYNTFELARLPNGAEFWMVDISVLHPSALSMEIDVNGKWEVFGPDMPLIWKTFNPEEWLPDGMQYGVGVMEVTSTFDEWECDVTLKFAGRFDAGNCQLVKGGE